MYRTDSGLYVPKRKPTGRVQINREHPLTHSLVAYWLFQPDAMGHAAVPDLVNKVDLLGQSQTATDGYYETTTQGMGLRHAPPNYASASAYLKAAAASGVLAPLNKDFSLALGYVKWAATASATYDNLWALERWTATAATQAYSLGIGDGNTGTGDHLSAGITGGAAGNGTTTVDLEAATALALRVPHVAVLTKIGVNAVLYADGKSDATTGAAPVYVNDVATPITVGIDADLRPFAQSNATWLWAGIWIGHALTAGEVAWLNAEPYAFVNEAPQKQSWFFMYSATVAPPAPRFTASRFRLQSAATFRYTATRFRLLASATRDTATRLRIAAGATRDAASRYRLQSAIAWRDAATRLRLAANGTRDAALRFRLGASLGWRFTAVRFGLAAASVRDTATRLRLQAIGVRDTAARFRLLASGVRDTALRFRLQTVGQAWRNTALRFRVQVLGSSGGFGVSTFGSSSFGQAALTSGFRFAAARFSLLATATRDTASRFRLAAQAFRDASSRFRLQSIIVWRDTASRFRLLATAYRDTSARFKLLALGTRDTAGRFRLLANSARDTAARLRVQAAATRDTALRFRLSVPGSAWRDSALRFRIQSQTLWRDSALRVRLAGTGVRDSAARVRLQSAVVLRDQTLRFRVAASTVRDTGLRARLAAAGVRDAAVRFRLQLTSQYWRDTALRFSVTSGSGAGTPLSAPSRSDLLSSPGRSSRVSAQVRRSPLFAPQRTG